MNPLNIFKSLEPNKLTNLILIFIIALLFWISITSLLPVLPTYIEDLGANPQQIGLIMGCFAIGLLFSRVWLGKLADQRSRKLVVLIGTFIAATAPIGYILFNTTYSLIFVRAYHGISMAAFTTGYSALVVDLSPPKHKGELIGYMTLAVPIGMAIGPAVGGYITNPKFLFAMSAICGFLGFILTNQVKETNRNTSSSSNTKKENLLVSENQENLTNNRSYWSLCVSPSLLIPTIILLLIGCIFGTLVSFLPLFIRSLKIDFNLGLFYTSAAIASFIARFVSGQASDRYGRGLFISTSILCYLGAMILLNIGNNAPSFLLAGVFEGMGGGIIIPIMIALISDRCSSNERGKVFAFCISGFDVGIALGGSLLGNFVVILGYRGIWAISAGLAMIAFVMFITFSNNNLGNSLKFAIGKAPDFYDFNQ